MAITVHENIEQGTPEWLELRRGILTASEVKLIITPAKLEFARNDKCRSHVYELAAQRISGYVEPHYISDDMLRGHMDEVEARAIYHNKIAPVQEVGFITNTSHGFTIGYSPDGLVGDDGSIEIKSRRQKYQVQTVIENGMPDEYFLQVQTGLLVSGREWLDFISYCGGMHFFVMRIYPDEKLQKAIIDAATELELQIAKMIAEYEYNAKGLFMTTRLVYEEEGIIV